MLNMFNKTRTVSFNTMMSSNLTAKLPASLCLYLFGPDSSHT